MPTAAAPDLDTPLLGRPDFRRFWCMRLAATAANQMMMVALGWQMYDLTHSAWDLGLVGLAQFLPALLLALPAGATIDHHDRKRVLAAGIATQLLVALVLSITTLRHHQGLSFGLARDGVLLLSAVLGAVRAFQMPASQALLPQLVPLQLLPRALALSSSALQGAIIAGPALGGVVYAFGAEAVYALSTAGFAVSLLWVWRLQPRLVAPAREPMSMRTVLAGLGFIWQRKPVLGAMSLDLFAVLLGGATALLPIFARDMLHTGPWGLGLLRGAPAAGALVVSLWLARRPVQRRTGAWLLGAVGAYGVTMLAFGLSHSFVLSLVALAASGGCDMVSVVIRQSLVQLETPDNMRGRVSAVNAVFIGASNQLGEFESGSTAAWLGPVASVVLGGVGTLLVVALWTQLFPTLARRDRLVPQQAGPSLQDQGAPG